MKPDVFLEMAEVQDKHWWFVARRRILTTVIHGLMLPPSSKILEVGCGTGGNLKMLAEFGDLVGMECDENAREIASQLSTCPVFSGSLPDSVPFADSSFDLICMLDVLEHIEEDDVALHALAPLLKSAGRILITVPAYPWLWSAHDEVHHHHRRYTARDIKALAVKAGFRVQRLGYYNSLLLPLIIGSRISKKLLRTASGSDATMPAVWVNAILRECFSLERLVLRWGRFPFGASLITLLEPSE